MVKIKSGGKYKVKLCRLSKLLHSSVGRSLQDTKIYMQGCAAEFYDTAEKNMQTILKIKGG